MANQAARQRRFKQKMAANNCVQVNVWVPSNRAASIRLVAALMLKRRRYTLDRLVDEVTGRIVSLNETQR